MSGNEKLLQEIARLGAIFQQHGDDERMQKVEYFAKKIIDEEYTIGFAGHFSAGKSSMINALTGDDLLPSSPIPTSANIVKVKKAKHDVALIYSTDGTILKYEGQKFADAIKAFSKDGNAVALVEIGHTESTLPEGITVMDTPGVDSTDDAHRLSTESALHLADLVFYTMDYNHVQSELNFRFTKELMRYNENVYLIINQIDKHRDSELSFEDFKQSVENSFALWGVYPKGIFFTSLKEKDHPHNDFHKVKSIVDASIDDWQLQFEKNAFQTLKKLQDEHEQFLREEIESRQSSFAEIVEEDEWNEVKPLLERLEMLQQKQSLLSGDEFARAFELERNQLLDNAAITPFETRELLKDYLESLSPRFKVGFLFGAKKTEEERQKRRDALARNIEQLVHAHIEVHLKALMKKSLKTTGILTDDHSLSIDAIEMTMPFQLFEEEFKAVDVITGNTVLNYADRLKTIIHLFFKRATDDWKHEMNSIVQQTGSEEKVMLDEQIEKLSNKVQAIQQVNHLVEQINEVTQWQKNAPAKVQKQAQLLISRWHQPVQYETIVFDEDGEATITEKQEFENAVHVEMNTKQYDERAAIEKARHVAQEIQLVSGFEETVEYLRHKANRLEGQQFTVALFGAFSAGKSSFSNALLGEKVLPVSPNPTTAAINRIRPVQPTKQHDTADVHLKTVERLTEDVARSFEALGFPIHNLETAVEKGNEVLATPLEDEGLHVHKSFIAAFLKGYPTYQAELGNVLTVGREEFVKFVAEEERSCFVDAIDFYFDCELTQKGITLVDTPGADSINARHTDVAFEYIRNADAILFVTYYNHAFARADREFLIQLGRVKDAFELDKMFFIVNAIDLAANDEEADAVKAFVTQELQTFGVRNPRVHGVSSLQALEAKLMQQATPEMAQFEKEFHHFLESDLKGIAIQALQEETDKTIHRLADLIERTEANLLRKDVRLIELDRLEEEIRQHYANSFAHVLTKVTHNEVSELVYYLLQRVFLRYHDFFKEAYNPATFAHFSVEKALEKALHEAVDMMGFDITQELKVTNLRVLQFMKKLVVERQRTEIEQLIQKDSALQPTPYEPQETEFLTFASPFPEPNRYRSVNRLFKNAKAFFEKGERDRLKEQLEQLLKEDASRYLEEQKEQLSQWANEWIQMEAEGLRQHLLKECMNRIEAERLVLQVPDQLEEWRAIYEKIEEGVLV